MTDLSTLITNLGIQVNDLKLLENAFVHRSYLNESRDFEQSNERLEYLGDAVLELATSEFLYHKYSSLQEGMLTNLRASLVRTESLAKAASELGFSEYLLMSKGEESGGGRTNTSLLANTFEAFLGALYLDQGFATCVNFLSTHLFGHIDVIVERGLYKDGKSMLQEIAQARFKATPKYELASETGPDHDKVFRMVTLINGQTYGVGEGKSKQAAQEDAAQKTLEMLNST